MKKYVKMLGLLLITGFVLAACGNETKDDLGPDDIVLADGSWDMAYSSTFEGLDASGASFVSTYVDSSRIQVSGDTLTIISGTYSQSYVYTFPESTDESDIEAFAQQKQEEQAEWEEEQETAGITVTTVSFEHTGRSVSITCAYEKTTKQIERQNQGGSVSGLSSGIPQNAVIKTNPGRTEYKITFSIAPDPNFPDDVGRDIVLVFKKV